MWNAIFFNFHLSKKLLETKQGRYIKSPLIYFILDTYRHNLTGLTSSVEFSGRLCSHWTSSWYCTSNFLEAWSKPIHFSLNHSYLLIHDELEDAQTRQIVDQDVSNPNLFSTLKYFLQFSQKSSFWSGPAASVIRVRNTFTLAVFSCMNNPELQY